MIILKSPREIERMKVACTMVAEVLMVLRGLVEPGISTLKLNSVAESEAAKRGAKPAFKGYNGYPYALCCSVNDQVVHGMPSKAPLKSGDIVSLDFGVFYDGFFGDAAITLPVGEIAEVASSLLKITEEALYAGIETATTAHRLSDISSAVQGHVESNGFSVVRDFVGHGIGKQLHESPQVPNYGPPGKGVKLKPGMVLAIEPMVNQRGPGVKILDDGWTAVTTDGGLSAHFEHTVAITEAGPTILTKL